MSIAVRKRPRFSNSLVAARVLPSGEFVLECSRLNLGSNSKASLLAYDKFQILSFYGNCAYVFMRLGTFANCYLRIDFLLT